MPFRKQPLAWYLICGVLLIAVFSLVVASCQRPVPREYYTSAPQAPGTTMVMQPDHSWFYYWMIMNMGRTAQPTFHIYHAPPVPTRSGQTPIYNVPSGQSRPSYVSPRSSGGFSAPRPSVSPRSTGGFSSPRSYSSPRSSGGFSGRRR